jgi:hypothetical protein
MKDAPAEETNMRYSGRMGSNAVDINAKVGRCTLTPPDP